jgi:hypothetical protein
MAGLLAELAGLPHLASRIVIVPRAGQAALND